MRNLIGSFWTSQSYTNTPNEFWCMKTHFTASRFPIETFYQIKFSTFFHPLCLPCLPESISLELLSSDELALSARAARSVQDYSLIIFGEI